MNEERFTRLRFPIHKHNVSKPTELFQLFPGLRRYFQRVDQYESQVLTIGDEPVLDKKGNEQTVNALSPSPIGPEFIRWVYYIIYLYDEGTDLVDDYPDNIQLRKDAAAKLAGFKRDSSGEWSEHVKDILELRNKTFRKWVLDYLKVQKNPVWEEIKIMEEELDDIQRRRIEGLGNWSKSGDLMTFAKVRREELDLLYKKFYADNHDLRSLTQKEIFPITPENVFSELDVSEEFTRVRQVRDVPPEARPQ